MPPLTVLVTGASGYIASHTIQQLLEKTAFAIRGTVRNLQDTAKFAHLTALPHADTRLQLVQADLLDAASWAPAVRGCAAVFHIASPFTHDPVDGLRDLVEPAVQGTATVLNAAVAEPSVQTIVLTSSTSSITDAPLSGKTYTEDDWNTTSSLTWNVYNYSKVCAEKKAWEIINALPKDVKTTKRFVVLNPILVLGPSLSNVVSESVAAVLDPFNGNMPMLADMPLPFVDVRDVARAHILALMQPAATGRIILAGPMPSVPTVVALMRAKYPSAKYLPTLTAPQWLVWVSSFLQKRGKGQLIRCYIYATDYGFDASKSKAVLGLTYRSMDETIVDTIDDAIARGFIDPAYV
ncbi:Aste57867_18573 [Aphanomyces stellatus]|uniref:Aste57867_18573 protein n=1 Tax=Aphanomyces stellatus TaxID=120398 RepID=A0A485LE81_9STRA|nr:hypothetical protein As57867_018511 [Aphanomyces stellatus]VFT95309.1 Aste57867_18573 [Aphanomyces stellatus]